MYQPSPTASAPPPPLSRTSSCASVSSEDDASMSSSTVTVVGNSTRRTRKRFTNVQLTMLENLFHQNSHPSREDREAVARAGGMEIKSVTIWFQNKRQTERKTAQASNPDANMPSPNVVPNITSTLHTFSLYNTSHSISRTSTSSPPFSVSSRSTTSTTTHSSVRPTLDRVASRSELRAAAPRTPRKQDPAGPIWDNMPSSPLAPPISPPAREFIDFGKNGKTRRTLEWACAAARLADKDGYASGMTSGFSSSSAHGSWSERDRDVGASSSSLSLAHISSKGRTVHQQRGHTHTASRSPPRREGSSGSMMDVDLTDEEDEDHEAITPPSTWGKDDRRWRPTGGEGNPSLMAMTSATVTGVLPKGVDDDDMLKAALALCGLGRRTQ
ncbi:homeobox-domain-containing protein [Pholiota conissans]|uniref:Homeobox-domain-containing protein n=1 Tax=Pholiota conissans TaxID=109636 RepID=A0A9P5ZGB1_9AGAR|nr:homeobox-domain-containing protein [Pholiota conissans]